MKADLTRSTFSSEKHYSGVLMQQGRVQLDADWNEQLDIGAYLDETTRKDVIGRCGVPLHDAGFGISAMAGHPDVGISPGRAYVDGILCENDASAINVLELGEGALVLDGVVADRRELEAQEWIELSATGVEPIVRRLEAVDVAARLVTLEEPLTAADLAELEAAGDPSLRRFVTYLTQPHFPGEPSELDLSPEPGLYLFYLDVWERHRTPLEDPDIREVALGGPDHATRTQTIWQVKHALVGHLNSDLTCATMPGWDELVPGTTGRLSARAHPATTGDDLCTIPPGAGFRRGENHSYRVEIRKAGDLGEAEFTFSRENASVVVPWLDSEPDTLIVQSLGRDEVLGIGPGDWVEVTDDSAELKGKFGNLAKVVTATGGVITLDNQTPTGSMDIAGFPLNPKVRRWDDPDGWHLVERPADNDGYLQLEDGVEVRFEPGFYDELGYWLLPARTALGDVDWPIDSAGAALAKPPDGVAHHYCKLAVARFEEGWELMEDCRNLFPPLTEITGTDAEPGVHVLKVASAEEGVLHNDGIITGAQLAAGIDITCDRDIEPGTIRGKPTCVVTLDLPFPANEADRGLWGPALVGTTAVTLTANAVASGELIRWRPAGPTRVWLQQRLAPMLEELEVPEVLVHLRLRGRFVYEADNPEVNVDGEAFGLLQGARLEALLPSGDDRRGGDLELWFRLRPRGGAPTGVVVLAAPTSSSLLTSGALRSAVSQAIGAIVPREELRGALPDRFEVDTEAVLDAARARELIAGQRLGEPGTVPTIVLAIEEPLRGAADVISAALEQNEVPLEIDVVIVSSAAELADQISAGRAPDLVLASQDTLDDVVASAPDSIAAEGTVVL